MLDAITLPLMNYPEGRGLIVGGSDQLNPRRDSILDNPRRDPRGYKFSVVYNTIEPKNIRMANWPSSV